MIQDKHSSRFESSGYLKTPLDFKLYIPGEESFICPSCGKKLKVKEAKVIPIQIESKHIETKVHGRMIERKYRDTYYNIRFCPSCAKRKRINTIICIIIFFIMIPLGIGIWSWCQPGRGFGSFLASFIVTEILCLMGAGLWSWATEGTEVNIDDDSKGNAIAPQDHF